MNPANEQEFNWLTKDAWIARYGGQDLLDHEGFGVEPCHGCHDKICHGWKVVKRPTVPTNSVEEIAREVILHWNDSADDALVVLIADIADALRAERDKVDRLENYIRVSDQKRDELRAQLAAERQAHGDLLAVIHGDGGHYIEEHGWEKAQTDAIDIVYKLKAKRERGESDRKRLDWLIEKTAMVVEEEPGNWFMGYMTKEPSKTIVGTPRECIDAVMLPPKPEVGE